MMQNHALKLGGTVTPPTDMVNAARLSLSEAAFNDLMNQTGNEPPTPAQLVAAVELERTSN